MNHRLFLSTLCLATALIGSAASAQPTGGFYLLKNDQSGKVLCSQTPISPDWVRQTGPYKDPDCKFVQAPQAVRRDLPANPLDLSPKK